MSTKHIYRVRIVTSRVYVGDVEATSVADAIDTATAMWCDPPPFDRIGEEDEIGEITAVLQSEINRELAEIARETLGIDFLTARDKDKGAYQGRHVTDLRQALEQAHWAGRVLGRSEVGKKDGEK